MGVKSYSSGPIEVDDCVYETTIAYDVGIGEFMPALVVTQVRLKGDKKARLQRVAVDLGDFPNLPEILRELADAIEEGEE